MIYAFAIAVFFLILAFLMQPANKIGRSIGIVVVTVVVTGAIMYVVFVAMGAW